MILLYPYIKIGEEACDGLLTHVDENGEFFVQVIGPGLEKLDIITKDISSHFSQVYFSEKYCFFGLKLNFSSPTYLKCFSFGCLVCLFLSEFCYCVV